MLVENNPYPQDGRVRREATSLAAAGYVVTVVAPSDGSQPRYERVGDVNVYRYPPPPEGSGLLAYVAEFGYAMAASLVVSLYVLARRGVDVIHVHNPPDTYVAIGWLFQLLGRTFVFDHHDLSPDMYVARFGEAASPTVLRVLRWLQRVALRTADQIIATNESYARVAMAEANVPARRIAVVRNGPDLTRVRVLPEVLELREQADHLIGYVGTMNPQDGVDYLLRALAHLARERRDFYCVLIGDGDDRERLMRARERLDLRDHVGFAGYLTGDALMRMLSTVDICVDPDPSNPYNDRSTMIKMTEYMALGKPIVAFDLPEHRVTAGEAALYAEPNDEADFARCISFLMNDADRRRAMGEIGRQRIESDLSWHRQSQRLLDAYRGILPLTSRYRQVRDPLDDTVGIEDARPAPHATDDEPRRRAPAEHHW